MAVDVELCHGCHHGVDFVLLAGQGCDQLRIVQTSRGRRQPDLHQRDRVRCQLQKRGVPTVDGVAHALGEVDAVAQTLLPVVHVVDRLSAGANVAALVHGGEVADLQRIRGNALQLRGQLTEQRIHLGGVAGTLGLEFAGELTFSLGAGDDRVHLFRWATDHGLGRCGIDAHLQIREVGEHLCDLLGGVLDQRHQPDVLAEQHRLALAHQVRTGADGARGISQ